MTRSRTRSLQLCFDKLTHPRAGYTRQSERGTKQSDGQEASAAHPSGLPVESFDHPRQECVSAGEMEPNQIGMSGTWHPGADVFRSSSRFKGACLRRPLGNAGRQNESLPRRETKCLLLHLLVESTELGKGVVRGRVSEVQGRGQGVPHTHTQTHTFARSLARTAHFCG